MNLLKRLAQALGSSDDSDFPSPEPDIYPESFDYKELDKAKRWVREQLKKGLLVFQLDHGDDSFDFYAGSSKEEVSHKYQRHLNRAELEEGYPLKPITDSDQVLE